MNNKKYQNPSRDKIGEGPQTFIMCISKGAVR